MTLNATAAGVVTITVTDMTPDEDVPLNGKADPIQFTVYVVKQQSAVQNRPTTFEGTDGVEYGYDTEDPQLNGGDTDTPTNSRFDFDTTDAPVYYTVEGTGQVYISLGGTRRTSPTKTLWTSSAAPVYLDVNRGTNKVNAYISGNQGKKIIFIFSGPNPDKYPEIEITGGNNQTGATEGRLEEYLEVKVTDGNRRPVSGVAVKFTKMDPGSPTDGSMFIPVSGTTVYGSGAILTTTDPIDPVDDTVYTTTATSNTPPPAGSIFVQTDRNGIAKVYYQLSNVALGHAVTAALFGSPFTVSKRFDVTAVTGSRSASLVLVSGDNQRSDAATRDVEDPLVVRVRRTGGYRIPNVILRFTALTGTLEAAPGTNYVAATDGVANIPTAPYMPTGSVILDTAIKGTASGQEIFVLTDAHGEAAAVYNAGQIAGAKIVTVRVDDEQAISQYDFQIRQVEFNIDGRTEPEPEPEPEPDPDPDPDRSQSSSVLKSRGSSLSQIPSRASLAVRMRLRFAPSMKMGLPSVSRLYRLGIWRSSRPGVDSTLAESSLRSRAP